MTNPIDRLLAEQYPQKLNPIDSLLTEEFQPKKAVGNRIDQALEPPSLTQAKGVTGVVADEIRKLGRDIVNALEYSASAGTSPGQAPQPSFQLRQHSRRAALHERAIAGDPEALEVVASSERGAAFLASTVASFAGAGIAPQLLRALPFVPYGPLTKGATLAAKALAFVAAEGTSGALYGAIRPLDGDESREKAMLTDAAIFVGGGAAFAGVFAGLFKAAGFSLNALGKLDDAVMARLGRLSKPEAEKVIKRAKKILEETKTEVKRNGGDPDGIAPELATATEARSINQALDELFANPPGPDAPSPYAPERSPYKPDVPTAPAVAAATPSPAPSVVGKISPVEEPNVSGFGSSGIKINDLSKEWDAAHPSVRKTIFGATEEESTRLWSSFTPDELEKIQTRQGVTGFIWNNADAAARKQIYKVDDLTARKTWQELTDDARLAIVRASRASAIAERQRKAALAQATPLPKSLKDARVVLQQLKSRVFDEEGNYLPEFRRNPADKYSGVDPTKKETVDRLVDEWYDFERRVEDFEGLVKERAEATIKPKKQSRAQLEARASAELNRTAQTIANDIASKGGQAGPLEEAALVNDAINVGVANTKPLDIMGEKVQDEAVKVVKRRLAKKDKRPTKDKAKEVIAAGIESDQSGGSLIEDLKAAMDDPSNLSELSLGSKPKLVPTEKVAKPKKIKKKSKLDNDPLDDVPTPWGEAAGMVTPKASGWATVNRAPEVVKELFDAVSLRVKLKELGYVVPEGTPDSELSKFLQDESGAVAARVAARLALTGLGTYGNISADKIEDDGMRNVAEAASWLVIAAGLSGFIKDGVKTNATLRKMAGWRDVRHQLSTAGSEEGANAWAGMVNVGNWEKTHKLRYLPRIYKTQQEREALAYVIAEGTAAPEWHMLSRDQQIQAAAENAYNFHFAMPWKVSKNYLKDYLKIIFPEEIAGRYSDYWKANGAARFPSLREAVNWARANNIVEPQKDGVFMQAKYTELMHKAMADVALKDTFRNMGLIAPLPKAGAALPNGWREVRAGGGLRGRNMAPEDVANLLEVFGQEGSLSNNKLVNAIDRIKRTYLYHINLVAIDLIRNMTLAASSVSLRHPTAWFDAMQKVVKLDPIIRDWARHGLDVTGQIDFGPLETAIKSIPQLNPTKNPFLKGYRFFNHLVLDIIQPGTILFAAELRKTQWLRKHGAKHLPGSPEYNRAMREIAEFANTAGGRLNQTFQDPRLKNAMKLAFFAPSWRQTRFNLFARAAGDLGDLKVFGGSKEFNEAWYLHAKMRQGMLFMGLTFGLSKLLGGEPPQFDVNNYRYYIRSGVFNEKGRELGIDFLGWYQDDLKLTSNPLEWIWAGANPVIKEGVEFFSGRDYNGNALTMGKRLEGLATGFGTTSAVASLVAQGARAAMGTEDISTADMIKTGSDVLTIPNVKTLPTHAEVTLSRVAKRILEEQGIPADKDAIYDLMQTMRGAILRDRDLGDAILPYIAYKKRQYSQGTPFLPLIDDIKDVLEDMVDSDTQAEEVAP